MASETYEKLNNAWKQTCKVILGDEIGDLDDYKEWLSEAMVPMDTKKSAVSGKEVSYAVTDYCKDAKFISNDEIDFSKKFEPLNINEIKDMDSIIESLQERFYYSGNIILNNSKFVEKSCNITNSFYVLGSNLISDSKYIGYCSYIRYGEYLFGVNPEALSKFVIRGIHTHESVRCLEAWKTYNCNDSHYNYGVEQCNDLMFCFNLLNKKYMIGNLQLTKDKYASIKGGLMQEIIEYLKKHKRGPDFLKLATGVKPEKIHVDVNKEEKLNKEPMEQAFRKTTRVVLGRELQDMDQYEAWLMKFNWKVKTLKSAVSGKPVCLGLLIPYPWLPEDRIIAENEGAAVGEKLHLKEGEIETLEKLKKSLGRIAYFNSETTLGKNHNVIDSFITFASMNCYRGPVFSEDEYCIFSSWPRDSKYMIGSHFTHSSNSSIRCNYSINLARCFELDGCSNSSDLYFSHNCENVNDSFFCFNAKNLKRAIGNAEYSPADYKKLKSSLLEQIAEELEKTKSFKWDIYNIGCGKVSR